MSTPAPAPTSGSVSLRQPSLGWLEAVVGDGFADSLKEGLSRSRYSRSRGSVPRHAAGPAAGAAPGPAGEPPLLVALPDLPADLDEEDDDQVWRERRRLARAVHDELGTALSTAARRIGQLTVDGEPADAHLDAALRAVQQALEAARSLAGGLHEQTAVPPLVRALEEFAGVTAPTLTDVSVSSTGDERLISDICRRELYLTAREAMRNAFLHAQARQVTVTLRFTRRWTHLGVQDDGVGFAADALLAPGYRAPGLRSMTDRVEDLGGRLTIESAPGQGTRIQAHLPLRPTP
ncbi:sensor histidine kinase [Streptomyces sp. NPDC057638]|uniref:sensor histidine kinase n=1 Tax=Streptomyces sp. NPDC057638 TaxID=3346190 RepID=UPI00368E66EC